MDFSKLDLSKLDFQELLVKLQTKGKEVLNKAQGLLKDYDVHFEPGLTLFIALIGVISVIAITIAIMVIVAMLATFAVIALIAMMTMTTILTVVMIIAHRHGRGETKEKGKQQCNDSVKDSRNDCEAFVNVKFACLSHREIASVTKRSKEAKLLNDFGS